MIPFRSTWYHPRSSAGNEKSGDCSRIVAVFVTRVKCLQHMWRKVSTNTVFRKTQWCHGGTGKQRRRHAVIFGEMASFLPFQEVRANDVEQWMREAFRVRVCERVDPGFLTTVEILRRKVAWNVEDFFWIDDPKYTLALDDEFGFDGKKQLVQTKNILVAPGSKTINEGLHDGADVLDERETQQSRSLIGTTRNVGQDRPETRCTTEESARFMSDPTRAVKCLLKRLCKHYSEASVHSWSFPLSRNAVRGQSGERDILGRGTGGTVNDGRLDLFWWLFPGDVFFDTADCGAVYYGE